MSLPAAPVETNPETAYETSDWRVGAIATVLAMLLALLVIAVFVLRAAFHTAASDVDRAPTVAMPEPALQADPAGDLARFRGREEQALNGYYWIDKERGIVHIPIEQAMQQVAAKGLDGFPQGKP